MDTSLDATCRVNLRASLATKQIIERAALTLGTTLSAFMLQNAYEAAQKVLAQQQVLMLSARDRDAFLAALAAPPEPTDKLRRLMSKPV